MKSDGAKTEATPSGQTAINTDYEKFILALSQEHRSGKQ